MNCIICNKTFETYEELTRHLVKVHNFKINEIYNYYNFSIETREATCPICGTKFKLENRQIKKWKEGISKGIGCCRKCGRKLMDIVFGNPSTWDSVKQKKKETNLKNWGVENVFQAKEIKEQVKKTNLEKYGVEYVMQSSQIKEKSKNTNIEKYGVEHVSQRKDIKEKKKNKSLEKYGVENISQAQEIKDKKKQKSLEVYGVPYTLQAQEVRERIKETSLEKYGTEFTTQAEEVKEHIKEANLKKYGYAYVGQVPEVKEKAKETNLKKYGVPYSIMAEEVKDKIKETNLERYGVEYALQSSEIQQKIKETMLEKYGANYAIQSSEVQEKIRESNIKKHGYENISQVPEIKEKKKQTMMEHYGVEYPLQSSGIQEKIKKTNLEKYGYEYPTQSPEIQKDIRKRNLEKYGIEWASQNPEAIQKRKNTNLAKYGTPYTFSSEEVRNKSKQTNLEKYGVEYFCQHEDCINAGGNRISKVNKDFQSLLQKNGIESELEFIVENSGFDLKVDNTLIEINPYYTHNVTVAPYFKGNKADLISPNYHAEKTDFAKKHGFKCIHIFDWDNKDKVISLLKQKEKIQGRKCTVKEIDRKIVDDFLGKYHLQGANKGVKFAYGLYYENELVEVMTFGKPRYNKNYEYELLRLCTKSGISVIGGANKLLKYFEGKVNPKSIISYCDLSKFSGDVYEKLGFKLLVQTEPAKHWFNPKTKKHITDNLLRQKGFDILHGTDYGKGTSNEELMKEYGYVEIYDCGQLVFTKEF